MRRQTTSAHLKRTIWRVSNTTRNIDCNPLYGMAETYGRLDTRVSTLEWELKQTRRKRDAIAAKIRRLGRKHFGKDAWNNAEKGKDA